MLHWKPKAIWQQRRQPADRSIRNFNSGAVYSKYHVP